LIPHQSFSGTGTIVIDQKDQQIIELDESIAIQIAGACEFAGAIVNECDGVEVDGA
jgi:hypothetical protein